MAAAIVASIVSSFDPSRSLPSLSRDASDGCHTNSRSMASKKAITLPRGKRERPCDACRKRKSRCVLSDDGISCSACMLHSQKCTYEEHPQPRKRRMNGNETGIDQSKRRSLSNLTPEHCFPHGSSSTVESANQWNMFSSREIANSKRSEVIQKPLQHYGKYIGPTIELEPLILRLSPKNATHLTEIYQDRGGTPFLVDRKAIEKSRIANSKSLNEIEQLIGSHGPLLLKTYLSTVHENFPIVETEFFHKYNSRSRDSLDTTLLAAIWTCTTPWLTKDCVDLDVLRLEHLAFSLFTQSLKNPSLATIQAGILLMQRPSIDSKSLNVQLVGAAYDLGLQFDCTTWSLTSLEKGLRKRLAWALFMQDKWCSLINGRPFAIQGNNWAVGALLDEDFDAPYNDSDDVKTNAERGRLLFKQMVSLTEILALVLDTFYTLKAMQEVNEAEHTGTRLILQRTKPIQIKLKEWFSSLPSSLKMDCHNSGYMNLAYFATEITLHRSIVRSLHKSNGDAYLSHICRSAAKTRLISAMDFVNRLRPEHLTSFWYFPSQNCFAYVGTFGSLLLATAPCQEEVEFYRLRLNEYRWTLAVSSRSAPFLCFALENLDTTEGLLMSLPPKPRATEIKLQETNPDGVQTLSPPREFQLPEEVLQSRMASLITDADSPNEASGLASPSTSTDSGSTYEAVAEPIPTHVGKVIG